MFAGSEATVINGLGNLNTKNVYTMEYMFVESKVQSLNLSNFNTFNVIVDISDRI